MERRGERNLVTSAGSFRDWSTVTHSHFATHLFTHSWIQQLTLPVMLLMYLSITCSLSTLATHRDQLITVIYSVSHSSINSLLFSSSSIYSFMNSAAFFPIFHRPLTKLLIMHWLFTYPSTYSVHFKVSNSITRILPCPLLGHLLVPCPLLGHLPVTYRSLTGNLLLLTLPFTRSLIRTYPVLYSVTYSYYPVLYSVTYSYIPCTVLSHLLVLTLSFTQSLTRTYPVLYTVIYSFVKWNNSSANHLLSTTLLCFHFLYFISFLSFT